MTETAEAELEADVVAKLAEIGRLSDVIRTCAPDASKRRKALITELVERGVKIKTIAEAAGVSASAVSQTLDRKTA